MSSSLHLGPFSDGPDNGNILLLDTLQKPQIFKVSLYFLTGKELIVSSTAVIYIDYFFTTLGLPMYTSINYSLIIKLAH